MNTSPLRRDACPSLSTPMRTGDGLLVRLAPLGGAFTPHELCALSDSAGQNGNGIIEVTARGNLQLRGLDSTGVVRLATDLERAGIVVRTGIPVEVGPLAGLDPGEVADPRPLAARISAGIDTLGLASRLGPKVSVVIDGGGRWSLDEIAADVRITAVRTTTGPAWLVAFAGDARSARKIGLMPEERAAETALAILTGIARLGKRARARDLADAHLGTPAPERDATAPDQTALQRARPPLGTFPLKADGSALAVALPFGSVNAAQLLAFASAAAALAAVEMRPAAGRVLIAIGLDAERAHNLRRVAREIGLVVENTDPRIAIAACPGAPACRSGRLATRAIAAAIAGDARPWLDDGLSLHVSGCPKGCAHPAKAGLTLVGDEKGVGIVVNGTAGDSPLAYSEIDKAVSGFSRVMQIATQHRQADESLGKALARAADAALLASAFRME